MKTVLCGYWLASREACVRATSSLQEQPCLRLPAVCNVSIEGLTLKCNALVVQWKRHVISRGIVQNLQECMSRCGCCNPLSMDNSAWSPNNSTRSLYNSRSCCLAEKEQETFRDRFLVGSVNTPSSRDTHQDILSLHSRANHSTPQLQRVVVLCLSIRPANFELIKSHAHRHAQKKFFVFYVWLINTIQCSKSHRQMWAEESHRANVALF